MIKALIPFLKNVKSQLLILAVIFAVGGGVLIYHAENSAKSVKIETNYRSNGTIDKERYSPLKTNLTALIGGGLLMTLSGVCIIGFIFKNGSANNHKQLFNELKEIKEILKEQKKDNAK